MHSWNFFLLSTISLLAFRTNPATANYVWPSPDWPKASPAEMEVDKDLLEKARDYALTADGAGMVIPHGRLIFSWGDTQQKFDLKSSSKGIGVTALGLALKDEKVTLDTKAYKLHPAFGVPPKSNKKTGWIDDITLKHLATQSAGFEKPGGYEKLLFKPGTKWHYSDGGPNWLAECLTLIYNQDMETVPFYIEKYTFYAIPCA